MPNRATASTFFLCGASACLGALAAIAWVDRAIPRRVVAQEFAQRPGLAQQPQAPRPIVQPQPVPPVVSRPVAGPMQELTPEEQAAVHVYENCNMSVVNISTQGTRTVLFVEAPTEGTGSGSIIDTQGHILTNSHVIEDARRIEVTLFNGQSFEGKLVGQDRINDVAVLKIDAPSDMLHPVSFGDSGRLRVGQNVYAIGNPFGLERTLTTGVVSSLNRSLPGRTSRLLKSIIQLDAAINPGNSGGPLLDSRGRLIGMNTAIASRTGQSSGVGFAIPVNTIARMVPQLITNGRIIRADAGIAAVFQTEQGLKIAQLVPGGPAEVAGMRGPKVVQQRHGPLVIERSDRAAADTVVAVNGEPTQTADEFLSTVESHQPGETVSITVLRNAQPVDLQVKLGRAQD